MNHHDTPATVAGEKRSRLEGGALTEEALDSSHAVLGPTGYGQLKGLQQYFSPPEAAALACRVITGDEQPSHDAPFQPPLLQPPSFHARPTSDQPFQSLPRQVLPSNCQLACGAAVIPDHKAAFQELAGPPGDSETVAPFLAGCRPAVDWLRFIGPDVAAARALRAP